jgi:hypothetical protein
MRESELHRVECGIVLSELICRDGTQTTIRGAIFSPKWPRFSVILTKFRGNSEMMSALYSTEDYFESTIRDIHQDNKILFL